MVCAVCWDDGSDERCGCTIVYNPHETGEEVRKIEEEE